MSILKKNNIQLNWPLAYIGLVKDWLSVADVLVEINSEELNKLDDNEIGELYFAADESKNAFLDVVKRISKMTDSKFKEGLWVWSVGYLNEIFKSEKLTSDKLKEVANVWVMVGYPEDWKGFIYYMPVSLNEEVGEDRIIDKLASFLEKENIKLKERGYLK